MVFSQHPGHPGHPGYPGRPGQTDRPRLDVEVHGAGAERELVLVKNGQRYVFCCAPGDEPDLLRRLGDLVRDPRMDLDWFDAAVLSHQIGKRLGTQLQRMQKGRS